MKIPLLPVFFTIIALGANADVQVLTERHEDAKAGSGFTFAKVPPPRRADAAAQAIFFLVDGERDGNGGELTVLHDGRTAEQSDQPAANFFFRAGSNGGRVLVDLGRTIDLARVDSYSWHPGTRAPQVYRLYGSAAQAAGFEARLKRPADPVQASWKLLASVDTRPKDGPPGGQYGVSITDSTGSLGSARYLLFDFSPTETADAFGDTFYSEIDVIDRAAPNDAEIPATESVAIPGGAMRFTIDTTEAPDLTDWAHRELVPVMAKWYPLIVNLLPSEGYTAPRTFSITFTASYHGVAATTGNRIEGSPEWYRGELHGEALGSMVHELVHVAQQYGPPRRGNATPSPGWLVEGMADYIRWYLYEPQSKGCEISPDRAAGARFDAGYRDSANFLNFVTGKYDKALIPTLNAALREGRYEAELWKQATGRTLEELADEWKRTLVSGTPPNR